MRRISYATVSVLDPPVKLLIRRDRPTVVDPGGYDVMAVVSAPHLTADEADSLLAWLRHERADAVEDLELEAVWWDILLQFGEGSVTW